MVASSNHGRLLQEEKKRSYFFFFVAFFFALFLAGFFAAIPITSLFFAFGVLPVRFGGLVHFEPSLYIAFTQCECRGNKKTGA